MPFHTSNQICSKLWELVKQSERQEQQYRNNRPLNEPVRKRGTRTRLAMSVVRNASARQTPTRPTDSGRL